MAQLVHHHDPFDPLKRHVYSLSKETTVRRLVQRHKGLRPYTRVFRPGGFYGRRQVREFSRLTVCRHRGQWLKRSDWKRAIVRPGDVVEFITTIDPKGGGGSNPLSVVLPLAIIVGAAFLGPVIAPAFAALGLSAGVAGALGAGVASLALGFAAYGIMSLFASPAAPAPPTTTGFGGTTAASSPTYSLQAQGNYNRLGSPIEELLGRMRIFPAFVTTPYQTFDGAGNQVLHHILGLSMGEVEIDETSLQLGKTPITSFLLDDGTTAAVEWAKIEPGATPDETIADERILTCTDIADTTLPDASAGSPWQGPFATGAQAIVSPIQLDFAAPQGLWGFDQPTGNLTAKTVYYSVRGQLVDDSGVPIGDPDDWEDLGSFSKTSTTRSLLRWTEEITPPSPGRWSVEVQRTDTQATEVNAGHALSWIGLKGRLQSRRTFPGQTCIAVKLTASGSLNSAASRSFNLICTRKLPTWDFDAEAMTTAKVATRNPCDAFAHIARSMNGANLADDEIDLAGLYANYDDFDEAGYEFNFYADQKITQNEALSRVARSVLGAQVVQGGKLRLVLDRASSGPIAMFSPRNILQGSLDFDAVPVDGRTDADAVIGHYIDDRVWSEATLTAAFDDSAQERPTDVTLHGVTNADQAWAGVWWLARGSRYRRRTVTVGTSMEGLGVLFGDPVSLSHDVPRWGQTLEVLDYDDSGISEEDATGTIVLTVSDPPDFSDTTATYWAAVRDSKGRVAGPFEATAVEDQDDQLQLAVTDPGSLPEILVGGDRERTYLQLGPGEAYAKPMKVRTITPRDESSAAVALIDDDPRMHAALPPLPSAPIGTSTDPITIHVTEDVANLNLRTLADDNGYSGVTAQQVTIVIDEGVSVYSADVSLPACQRGTWPSGYEPILENLGSILGAPGAGGAGGSTIAVPVAGGFGGRALDVSSGPITVSNATGTIKGGAGGGGGGGAAAYDDGGGTPIYVNGGAGGQGHGYGGGPFAGDAGDTSPTLTAEGGTGGTGGEWGSFGNTGDAGITSDFGGAPIQFGAAGGPPGYAILGLANITFDGGTGVIVGPTA